MLATLSLAVEWLLQAPQEVRQSAMLRAAQLLLTFTLSPRHAQQHARGGAAAPAGSSSEALESVFPGSVAASPGITPTRQQPAQHRLAGQAPAPLQLPPSPGMSPSAPEMLTPGGLPPRPVSPSLAALKAAAAAASGAGAASADSKRPSTPRAGSFERLQGAAEPTSISATALAAAAAPLGGPLPPAGDGQAGQAEAAAAAACEASATVLWSFLSGQAMVPHVRVHGQRHPRSAGLAAAAEPVPASPAAPPACAPLPACVCSNPTHVCMAVWPGSPINKPSR